MKPREIRVAVGMSCVKVAKLARHSRHTVRVYEADPGAVEPEIRSELDELYCGLRDLLTKRRSEPPPFAA